MAQVVSVVVYKKNDAQVGSGYGGTFGLPTSGIIVEPADAGIVVNGVTMVSCLKALPDAAYRQVDKYYSPTAIATIITACNA